MGQIAVRKFLGSTSALTIIYGKAGDLGVDTTKFTAVVFDGVTAGGNPLARADTVWPDANSSTAGYMSAASFVTLQTLAAIGNASPSQAGYMSAADYNLLQSVASVSASIPNASGNIPNTLVLRDSSGNFAAGVITASLTGNVTGNASTATNGVVTTGTYADPAWITSLNGSKITGTIGSSVIFLGSVPWTSVTGKPTVVSYFLNDAGYINGAGNTTGTSGGVLSVGGRETASPTPSTVVFRGSTGTSQIATPVNPGDIANKAYVDANGGSYGYRPGGVLTNPSNPIAAGGSIAPFNLVLLNETATGYIKYISIDCVGIVGSGNLNNINIGFTVDGTSEVSYVLGQFCLEYGLYNNASIWNGNIYMFKMQMDLPYKISIAIRLYTTVTLSFPSTEFATFITRYIRSS